jgi:hypothetical protein
MSLLAQPGEENEVEEEENDEVASRSNLTIHRT